MMDDKTLAELRDELRHMDGDELKAYGRQFKAMPESCEYLEAQAEWQRRQQMKPDVPKPQPVGPTSEEIAAMAAAAPPGAYPWKRYPSST